MDFILNIAIWVIPLVLAISLHEAAHGWIAHLLGDSTAKQLGRLTANPVKHIDPIGTLAVPLFLLLISKGTFAFGWAKPVPVDPRYFKSPQKDMALVALAGPASNFAMAIGWILLMLFSHHVLVSGMLATLISSMAEIGVVINLILMVLNLFPIPPLDGGRIVTGVMPPQLAAIFGQLEMMGMWIVIFLLASGILGKILWPMVRGVQSNLYAFFGIG
ncbi:MAG: site-2 protease family protein [Gammaproteobacteria bacterium]|nr:MAG: site-2 protease family protein [Gammaproteobacteria bacterium]